MSCRTIKCWCSYLCLLLLVISQTKVHDAAADIRTEAPVAANDLGNFHVFTVATEETDGYKRFIRSAKVYDIKVQTLAMGEVWKGGNMQSTGGGFKLNLLKETLENLKLKDDDIVMFTDSYDVIFTSRPEEIIEKFKESKAKILFSAEKFCWPDVTLAKEYPSVPLHASQYLNSGGFIGYAAQIKKLLSEPIKDSDDDQLYFTKQFLNKDLRASLEMQLDTHSRLFQNLHGAKDDVKLDIDLDSNEGTLQNIQFLTRPSVIHGNGLSKNELNAFANYLAKTFNTDCLICQENRLELMESNLPKITLAIFITQPVPFFDVFLKKVANINYPKNHLHLFVYSNIEFHDSQAQDFVKQYEGKYASTKIIVSADFYNEERGRSIAVEKALQQKTDFLFVVDADAHLDDEEVLREMISYNRQFMAPVMSRYLDLWSNFWGDLSDSGYYARSHDYVDIVKSDILGMWNVPYVSSVYLIKKSALKHLNFKHSRFDPDMAMCDSLRKAGVFMYVTNQRSFGHLVNTADFDITVTRPDFYTLFSNKFDWTAKYIHPNYRSQLDPNITIPQPCPDVFWFQIGTDAFCDDLVAIMEANGGWSDGSNTDKRLEGGYEAVPTRDIHMKQVGLDPLWLEFLKLFVTPLQERVFLGYFHNPPKSLMNFVVRYRPDEQPSLRPHHDSSTYTINIALNRVGKDYEGGGCRFLRYDCSVTDTKKGWMLMHPGRLTHFHEGLKVLSGTRYIMISFIDP